MHKVTEKLFHITDEKVNISLVIEKTGNGSYSSEGKCPAKINLISITATRNVSTKTEYIHVLTKIAKAVSWMITEEEDDAGNENVILWQP